MAAQLLLGELIDDVRNRFADSGEFLAQIFDRTMASLESGEIIEAAAMREDLRAARTKMFADLRARVPRQH